jgi:glycosyltransferase involved in cell wall biosynthesis
LRLPYLLGLERRGFRVTAASTGDPSPFIKDGIEHLSYQFNRFSFGTQDLQSITDFRRLIIGLNADIVHSFDTKPNVVVPFAVRNAARIVRTINGLGWVFSSREIRALLLRPVYCGLQRAASVWTGATIFQNRDDHELFKKFRLLGGSQSRIIASSGINSAQFVNAFEIGPSRDKLRASLGLTGKKVIIYVGRLTRQKGVPTLLEAFSHVVRKVPDVRLVLVGPLESEGPFGIRKEELGRFGEKVLCLGRRGDVPALLRAADMFAFPTEYREGVPRVLLEAGLAELPIVASRMPGCSDVVDDGKNGILVDPGNPVSLGEAILKMFDNPVQASAMGACSPALVRERFELDSVIESYCEVYRAVLSNSRLCESARRAGLIHGRMESAQNSP